MLLGNRIAPTSPTQRDLDELIAEYVDVTARARAIVNAEDEVTALIEEFGFSVERRQSVRTRCTTPPRTIST